MMKTLALLLSASLAACAGEAAVHYSGDSTTPELVAIDTDASVQVVANADEPIFYTENTYYLYRKDHWYRSSSHRGDWKRIDDPPEHIRRIDQPLAYVHYRRDPNTPRTTFNQREQPAPQPDVRNQPDRAPETPPREPNPQGPTQPYANPQPPQQVPPSPDANPTLEGPRNPRKPDQVPPVAPPDRPNHQIAPDPDRAPTSPGMDNRARDQRPANDRDKKPDDKKDKQPDDKNPDGK